MVLLNVFSLPIMNYKTLFLQKRYCSLLNQNTLLVNISQGEEKTKKQKNKYKEEIKMEKSYSLFKLLKFPRFSGRCPSS